MLRRHTDTKLFLGWVITVAATACATSNTDESERQASGGASSTSTQTTVGSGASNTGGVSSTETRVTTVTPLPITCRKTGDGTTTLVFVNGCASPLSVRGSNGVSVELSPGEHGCVDLETDVEPLNSLRYWGFVGDDPGGERHTLAEMTLNTDFNDFDWYNLSHVDAHNLPMQIVPIDAANCRTLTCSASLLANCPEDGRYRDSTGTVTACVSPDRDNVASPVAQYFEASCSDAYSWSGDDSESMAACAGEDYDVVFCP